MFEDLGNPNHLQTFGCSALIFKLLLQYLIQDFPYSSSNNFMFVMFHLRLPFLYSSVKVLSYTSQKIDETVRKEKEDTDKQRAERMRKMAMEKLGETQKGAVKGEKENHMKKKRRSGNETISFLCEKAESEKALRYVKH